MAPLATELPASSRVVVLLTDWAEPEGFDATYRREVVQRSFGSRALSPDEPCTAGFVGEFPHRQQLGLVPFAVGFETRGAEGAYDAFGLYRLSADATRDVSIVDAALTLDASAVTDTPGLITRARDLQRPLQRSFWALDPRDGTDYLAGVVRIGAPARGPGPNSLARPNGIRDADELRRGPLPGLRGPRGQARERVGRLRGVYRHPARPP